MRNAECGIFSNAEWRMRIVECEKKRRNSGNSHPRQSGQSPVTDNVHGSRFIATYGGIWCLKLWLKGYSLIQRKLMKRSGTILLCLACGMALSVVAQAGTAPTPASPKPDAAHQSSAAQRKLDAQKRIEELKKKIRA